MSLLALDIGSSACKAAAFATSGGILAEYACRCVPTFRGSSFAELNPEALWNALCCTCGAVAKNSREPIQVLAISSHGETFVAVDAHGSPVRPAILNQDNRAIAEAERCEQIIGRQRLFAITGLLSHPMFPIPKILWLRRHEPQSFESAKAFITPIGYLLQKMGMPPYVDYSLASRFLCFDVRKRCWSDEILNATELRRDCLPDAVPAGTIVGKLNSQAAGELGLPTGTPVVLGGHDQPCGALGSGVIEPGRVSDSMGTYECLLASSELPSLDDKALAASLNSYCHVVPDKFVTIAYFPSGIMMQWFHDLLYAEASGGSDPETTGQDAEGSHYALFEARAPEGPTGLCVTPHLMGTCNPEFNPRTRGVIAGLNPATGRSHIYKGILEGLACELSILTGLLAEAVGEFSDIYVSGGGTRSALGLQLRAALTGRRLHILRQQETVCLGTAILAGLAIGEYRSIPQAVGAVVRETATLAPDRVMAESYRDQVKQYRRLRAAVVEQS
jgi:xylulokinase